MPKQKYNWAEIKREFFESEYKEIKQFMKEKYKIYNATIATKTKGWSNQKREREQRINEKALLLEEEREAKQKSKMMKNIVTGIAMKVKTIEDLKKLSAKELSILWKMIRVENNLPTFIAKNDNDNTHKFESLSGILKSALDETDDNPSETTPSKY